MRYEAFYVIRPAAALQARLRQAAPDLAELLDRPMLWSKQEGGRTAWTEEDYCAQVKLLFLLDLWSDYVIGAGEERSLREFLEALLAGPPFTEAQFDAWWQVERFDGVDESFEQVEQRLSVEQPHLLGTSALPRVAAWMNGLEKNAAVSVGAD